MFNRYWRKKKWSDEQGEQQQEQNKYIVKWRINKNAKENDICSHWSSPDEIILHKQNDEL